MAVTATSTSWVEGVVLELKIYPDAALMDINNGNAAPFVCLAE